jgi:hypothetical protein
MYGFRCSRKVSNEAFLTMEDSGFCYTANEQRLLVPFPCNTARSTARRTPFLEMP